MAAVNLTVRLANLSRQLGAELQNLAIVERNKFPNPPADGWLVAYKQALDAGVPFEGPNWPVLQDPEQGYISAYLKDTELFIFISNDDAAAIDCDELRGLTNNKYISNIASDSGTSVAFVFKF